MKRFIGGAAALLLLGGTAVQLSNRWREEKSDRWVTLLVDWIEARDEASREAITDDELLDRLRNAGLNALLVGPATIQDYLAQDVSFSSRVVAQTVQRQLLDRGVAGVTVRAESGTFRLVRSSKKWEPLKDLEVGFNPELLGKARQAGFLLVLRVNNDPWLPAEKLFEDLQEISSANQVLGILLNTDEVPGGTASLPKWAAFLGSQKYPQLMFEFHPTKSSVKLAFRSPQSTYRAHTIASNELKDLSPAQQKSRWRRAVRERSCRFLLLHASPNDSLSSFLENITLLRQEIEKPGWGIGWPKPRLTWAFPSYADRRVRPVLALLLAILLPGIVLYFSLGKKPWPAYFQIVFLIFAGACIVAALADSSLTRAAITPFRGVKLAFALGLFGSFAALYPWKEIEAGLFQGVRRIDILAAFVVLAVLGYLWIRMGNTGAGWKVGWEQGLRNRLEDLLVARPRFKEFAIGYPLLFLGLQMRKHKAARALIGIGMIGPISMINTFCHLHSPLYLAFWRSMNGIVIGTFIGMILWMLVKKSGVLRPAMRHLGIGQGDKL